MATVCHILSDGENDLWQYSMSDGRNMQKAVAQPALLFSICNISDRTYLELWKSLEHFPTNDEVIRNLPIRHPLLWL